MCHRFTLIVKLNPEKGTGQVNGHIEKTGILTFSGSLLSVELNSKPVGETMESLLFSSNHGDTLLNSGLT